jgi:ABC-type transporter Mla MlaB component
MIPARPTTVVVAIEGPIARADLPGLCDRVCGLLARSGARVAVCEVGGVDVDAVTVDALARLQLAARRHGCQVRLRHAPEELRELVAFMGLTDVLIAEEPMVPPRTLSFRPPTADASGDGPSPPPRRLQADIDTPGR